MARYNIYAGVSFDADYQYTDEFENEEEALEAAYQAAVENYESYGGLHGLRDRDEIMEEYCEENGVSIDKLAPEDEEAIDGLYIEEIESWINYHATLESEDPDHDAFKEEGK